LDYSDLGKCCDYSDDDYQVGNRDDWDNIAEEAYEEDEQELVCASNVREVIVQARQYIRH
jgi:hypothetical protein